MDYEKKYKDALEIVMAYYNRTQFNSIINSQEEKETLERAFPELKEESEDERIRNGLLKVFKQSQNGYWAGMEIKDIVAYLEKIGERKYLYYDQGFIEGMRQSKSLANSEIIVSQPKLAEWSDSVAKEAFIKALERAVEQTKNGHELTDCDKHSWWEDFKKYSGIKPAEWSEEDEAAFGDLMWCIEQARKSAQDENDMGDIWFAENWLKERLKSLRPTPKQKWNEEEKKVLDSIIDDYEKAAKSFCGYDGKIGLLKAIRDGEYDLSKQEWSEEDKNRHYFLCKLLRETWDKAIVEGSCIDDAITWFEKLPERIYPHSWKPSKEQMEVLEYYMHALMCTKNKEILFGLYSDLKKL